MDASLGWDFVKAQLPAGWRELADELGIVRPQPAGRNAKITDIEQLLRLEFHRAQLGQSLKQSTAEAAAAGLVDLSSVSLHHWECKLGPYLGRLLAMMIEVDPAWARARWHGFEIVLCDGTTVQRTSATGVTARITYAMRLADMSFAHVELMDEHGGETLRGLDAHRGQLWVVDRFFTHARGIASIKAQGADVVGRYNRGTMPLFDAHDRPFDVLQHVRRLRAPGAMRDWKVWAHCDGKRIRGRLCAVRLPDDKAEEARERLRREHSRHQKRVAPEALEATAWLMIFTTVACHKLRSEWVLDLYTLRWQIELEIKRDKSIGDLDKLPNVLPETIQTWLYLKLILQQIERKIVSGTVAIPPSVDASDFAANHALQVAQADGTRDYRSLARAQARTRRPVRRAGARAAA
jgi:hypothetical protein